jgi:hypothetical protein
MIDPKNSAAPCFFLLVSAHRGACRLSLFFLRGHECGKADDYKGFCVEESKPVKQALAWTKKSPN